METMTQPKITGYRQLTEVEAALMNEIKALGEEARTLVHRVRMHIEEAPTGEAHTTITDPIRWASIATTDLQQGFMALTRAVAQPTTF